MLKRGAIMKKCRLLTALLCLLLLAGCGRTEAGQVRAETIMVDGVLYHSTGRQIPGEVDESAVIGTSTYTDGTPAENGQANFSPDSGAEYAMTSDGLVVCVDLEWTLFVPEE